MARPAEAPCPPDVWRGMLASGRPRAPSSGGRPPPPPPPPPKPHVFHLCLAAPGAAGPPVTFMARTEDATEAAKKEVIMTARGGWGSLFPCATAAAPTTRPARAPCRPTGWRGMSAAGRPRAPSYRGRPPPPPPAPQNPYAPHSAMAAPGAVRPAISERQLALLRVAGAAAASRPRRRRCNADRGHLGPSGSAALTLVDALRSDGSLDA